jgi:hypothetical protein
MYIQQDATIQSLFISGNCSTCFGWYFHTSSGAHSTVSTASGICHTVTAICRYRGRVGTGLSVLWVAYATHSKLKPVPTVFHPDPARKLSANMYNIYHCCVCSEKLLMMDRGTVQNMWSFIPKINLRN